MSLRNLFRRVNSRPSQLAAELTVPQHELPTDKHRQIMQDLVDAGATTAEALAIVAKSATRNWHGAVGNHTRGNLAEGQMNATEGRLGGQS
jgi:hypothetical protein